jgi:transcriptional regulator with XRE-family HTH domain
MSEVGRPVGQKNTRHFLREWRQYRDLSQDALAERITTISGNEKFERTRVSKFERGTEKLPEEVLYWFAEALDIEPGWVFVHPDVIMAERQALTIFSGKSPAQIKAIVAALQQLSKAS